MLPSGIYVSTQALVLRVGKAELFLSYCSVGLEEGMSLQ